MTPILIAPPAVEPLGLAETKAWLRVETAAEDELVGALIASARLVVESLTRRTLVSQTWRLVLDAWPPGVSPPIVPLPFSPVRNVPAVRVFNALGEATSIAPQVFAVETVGGDARLRFSAQPPAPGRAAGGIEIDVEAGFSPDAAGVPAPLRQAMRLSSRAGMRIAATSRRTRTWRARPRPSPRSSRHTGA